MSTNKHIETDQQTNAEAMDKLRDRTDELELIISSLTIFALLTIPGWLFDKIANVYTHLSTSMIIGTSAGATLLAGISYGLAACFILHLMARAYWVGLIGLRAAFPEGINWNNTPGLGPISRNYYREILPDLGTMIQKTDQLASSLFAVISMLTLIVLWFGVIFITTLVVSGAIGTRFGITNTALGIGTLVLIVIFAGAPILLYLFDAQLAKRVPRLRDSKPYLIIIRVLQRVTGLAYPQRLVLPVQLTLQSNTRPVIVIVALALSIIAIVITGNTRATAWRSFTISNEFTFLDSMAVDGDFRSTYYEDMPSSLDKLRGWPRVDSFYQSASFIRLFLPYQPLRDNLVLEQLCTDKSEHEKRVDCLRSIWTVSIEGKVVPMSEFQPAERADINMRGLIGLVPTSGLKPGLKEIEVVWNPNVGEDAAPLDDRYSEASLTFVIPIAFAPGYELSF